MQNKHTILIVGCGRLGSRTAKIIAEQNIQNTELILCDYDIVMQDNLHEQPIYTKENIGELKVDALSKKLKQINPNIHIITINQQFSEEILHNQNNQKISIILDGTDNLETRTQLNRIALQHNIPLIIAAATESHGMLFPTITADDTPCWECIAAGKQSFADCSSGIDNTLADTIAKTQVELCTQILQNELVTPKLYIVDKTPDSNTYAISKKIVVRKNNACVCTTKKFVQEQFTFKPCLTGRRLIARTTNIAQINFEYIKKNYIVQKEYTSAILIDLKIGTALVHKYGAIEFDSVPEDVARKFSKDVITQ